MKIPMLKIYTTPTCYWGHAAKDFFNEHKVKSQEIDVSKDQKLVKGMIKKSWQMRTLVIDVDGKIIAGFDEDTLRKTLKIM